MAIGQRKSQWCARHRGGGAYLRLTESWPANRHPVLAGGRGKLCSFQSKLTPADVEPNDWPKGSGRARADWLMQPWGERDRFIGEAEGLKSQDL